MRKESDNYNLLNCVICKEDRIYYSFGSCEHRKICNYCSMRSRMLYKDLKCPLCSTKLENIFIFEFSDKPSYEQVFKQRDEYYPDENVEENGIYYGSINAQEEALLLKNFICPIRGCNSSVFENQQILNNHLMKVHKKSYCSTCLKEAKKFLSEMNIYSNEKLNEHMSFGEFNNKGVMLSPPHPLCPFCNLHCYNDEILFKHMNEEHFICQLCKDKKSIIFYKEIPQLVDHYSFRHYLCPYQECLDDMFVVFDTEEKLNSHLINKHKCIDTKKKINEIVFGKEAKIKKIEKSKSTEFNFTSYIDELKERMNNFITNVVNKRNKMGNDDIEVYTDERKYNSYNKYNQRNKKYNNEEIPNDTLKYIQPDYSFVFQSYIKLIKEYITEKIKNNYLKEKEFSIPKETIYQMIMIIDKLELYKLGELQSLNNFAIDLEVTSNLRKIIVEGLNDPKDFFKILNKIDIKKVLIIYKYFQISYKKISNLFYKLELEQIEENLYDEFIIRDKSKKIENLKSVTVSKQINKEITNKIDNRNNKLNKLFEVKDIEYKNLEVIKEPKKIDIYEKKENKLSLLLDNKIENKPPPKKDNNWNKKKKFDPKNYNDDFPELN